MSPERRYQLQSEEANRRIDALLEQLQVPVESWRSYAELLTTVLKMYEDQGALFDLKIANAALKELRYGFKVFSAYRGVPKVTVFGSARTPPDHPISKQARAFGQRMTAMGWMVVTGAGSGVMGAAQEGAGRDRSFGLNIRLPFEQEANPWIAADPKLITFKYFFTRKLFLVREADAMVFFPGGFGTCDEVFETLTLLQTGKAPLVPIVLLDAPGGGYWRHLEEFIRSEQVEAGMVAPEDVHLFRRTDDLDAAVEEVTGFFRVYHSQRWVGEWTVLRLNHMIPPAAVEEIGREFADILRGPIEQRSGPLPEEREEFPGLPRLVLPFTRHRFARLRQLVDAVNRA
ncbi:MAG: TIGR00730 family Rossman fold protein [Candidatus Rokubacteria bacterium]|nr:TIGR00730 family Rossman fold protein [Candidatus Rokubacteria bacterium]